METILEILELPDAGYGLAITDCDDATAALFEERGLQGGGYTWAGIAEALTAMKNPSDLDVIEFDAEADNACLVCSDRAPLERLEALLRLALSDRSLLLAAIDRAGDDLE